MRKEVVAFVSLMIIMILVAQYFPGYLEMPAKVVQERMMLVLLPILLVFVWWTW